MNLSIQYIFNNYYFQGAAPPSSLWPHLFICLTFICHIEFCHNRDAQYKIEEDSVMAIRGLIVSWQRSTLCFVAALSDVSYNNNVEFSEKRKMGIHIIIVIRRHQGRRLPWENGPYFNFVELDNRIYLGHGNHSASHFIFYRRLNDP